VRNETGKIFSMIGALIHSRETGVGAKDLAGPVGILAILANAVNNDYRLALSFLVMLNINLAIINLLPFPVLDGGHILMAIIEKIRRRPLSIKFVEYATTGFAVLLISLMLYITFGDVKRFSLYRAMFKSDVQIQQSK
jgi:regulator of sigma E protease